MRMIKIQLITRASHSAQIHAPDRYTRLKTNSTSTIHWHQQKNPCHHACNAPSTAIIDDRLICEKPCNYKKHNSSRSRSYTLSRRLKLTGVVPYSVGSLVYCPKKLEQAPVLNAIVVKGQKPTQCAAVSHKSYFKPQLLTTAT